MSHFSELRQGALAMGLLEYAMTDIFFPQHTFILFFFIWCIVWSQWWGYLHFCVIEYKFWFFGFYCIDFFLWKYLQNFLKKYEPLAIHCPTKTVVWDCVHVPAIWIFRTFLVSHHLNLSLIPGVLQLSPIKFSTSRPGNGRQFLSLQVESKHLTQVLLLCCNVLMSLFHLVSQCGYGIHCCGNGWIIGQGVAKTMA